MKGGQSMSSISGISSVSHAAQVQAAVAPKAPAAKAPVRDADGDFDGTKPGSSDPMDFGKGQNINRKA